MVNGFLDPTTNAGFGTSVVSNRGEMEVLKLYGSTKNALSPQYYLEDLYQEYSAGKDLEEIARCLIMQYLEVNVRERPAILKDMLTSFDKVKDHIYYRLINTDRNRQYLKNSVFEEFLDLSVVYCILIEENEGEIGSAMVTRSLLKLWNVPLEEIRMAAKHNTERLFPVKKQGMYDVIKSLFLQGDPLKDKDAGNVSDLLFEDEKDADDLIVLTNMQGINGFGTIFYKDCLKQIAEEKDSSLYILPSSLHESIICPVKKVSGDLKELQSIVKDVNRTCVSIKDFLSDHVYFYDKDRETITFAEGGI